MTTQSPFTKDELQRIADSDHVQCGDAAALARALLAAYEQEPVATVFKSGDRASVCMIGADLPDGYTDVFTHPAPSIPTAEHRGVIEMLLSVCGAAFELADDSCEQEVEGETCTVVPSDAFQKLSDALDEIENSLPTEDADKPDVFLAWAAMPRAALKSLLHPAPSIPAVPDDKQVDELTMWVKRLARSLKKPIQTVNYIVMLWTI